jgi:hypothetical protein
MKRISDNETMLTRTEQDAFTLYHEALDYGYSVAAAVVVARTAHPRLSDEFYDWLGR